MVMPTLYVRNCPDELYRRLRDLAGRRQRSIGAEVVIILEEGVERETVRERRLGTLENIAKRRRSWSAPPGSADSLDLLREDRSR